MNPGILYSIIAAIVFGFWTIFHQQAADKINYLVGAIIVSLTAVVLGLIFLLPKIKSISPLNSKGVLFAILAGICALAIDFFALKAYGSKLPISTVGPIIIGGSMAIASTVGFLFLGESLTLLKLIALILIIVGASVLATITK